mgnify:CR=1 FL=1
MRPFARPSLFGPVIALVLAVLTSLQPANAENTPPNVVVTIRPLHSIAAAVMRDVGEPILLMKQGSSPHGAALLPSQRRTVQDADMVVWIGPALESAMKKSFSQIAGKTSLISAMEAPGLKLYDYRHPETGEEHSKDGDDEHAHEHKHEHEGSDPHIWLSPENAGHIARQLAVALAKRDPKNAAQYKENARQFGDKTADLSAKLLKALRPVAGRPFLTLHDGFQYFQRRFGLVSKGTVFIDPERPVSAKHVQRLINKIESNGIKCLLTEPQYSNRIVDVLSAKPDFKVKQVDPIGSDIAPGPDLYFTMMEKMAEATSGCLQR